MPPNSISAVMAPEGCYCALAMPQCFHNEPIDISDPFGVHYAYNWLSDKPPEPESCPEDCSSISEEGLKNVDVSHNPPDTEDFSCLSDENLENIDVDVVCDNASDTKDEEDVHTCDTFHIRNKSPVPLSCPEGCSCLSIDVIEVLVSDNGSGRKVATIIYQYTCEPSDTPDKPSEPVSGPEDSSCISDEDSHNVEVSDNASGTEDEEVEVVYEYACDTSETPDKPSQPASVIPPDPTTFNNLPCLSDEDPNKFRKRYTAELRLLGEEVNELKERIAELQLLEETRAAEKEHEELEELKGRVSLSIT
jgi:hypothetical protein